MLLKLGEKKYKDYPILDERGNEVGKFYDSYLNEKDAEEIITRNNKLEPSEQKKIIDEFTGILLAFTDKHNLATGEIVALMESSKYWLYSRVGGAIKQDV